MKRPTLSAAVASAVLGAAAPGTASAADCQARMETLATDYADFFTSRNTVFLNNQPVLRDLRNAAVRLQAQGLEEACGDVVSAMETAIAAYRDEGGGSDSGAASVSDAESAPEPTPLEAKAPTGSQVVDAAPGRPADAAAARPFGGLTEVAPGIEAPGQPASGSAAEARTATPSALPDAEKPSGDAGATRAELEARAVSIVGSDVLRDTAGIAGRTVYNLDNERLGEAQGLLLLTGAPTHLVVDHGGFWNLGQRRVAIPADIVLWDPDRETFVVPMTADQLAEAPKYDGADDAWTAQANDGFYAPLAD